MPGGSAALCGFIGGPSQARKGIAEAALREQCRVQFVRTFGPRADQPRAEMIKDWAVDSFTANAADLPSTVPHSNAPASMPVSGGWQQRQVGIATERES